MKTANQTPPASVLNLNNVPIRNVSMHQALDLIDDCIDQHERRCFFFINAHCVNVSVHDREYHQLLQREDAILFGDGSGVRIAACLKRLRMRDNVNGTDMFPLLCERAVERNRSFFLLGGQPGVPDEVAQRMTKKYPGLRIAGFHHGYFDESEAEVIVQMINSTGADILFVAFGVPRQEYWIARHRSRLTAPAAIGVGGLFDFYGGRIRRAPRLMRRLGVEWAWRFAMEPRRMWKRYIVGNFTFMGRVLWWTLRGR